MAEESHLERTEPASPRRLEQAREEGNVARSPELSAFAVVAAALAAFWFYGETLMGGLKRITARGLTLDSAAVRDPAAMGARLYDLASEALTLTAPLFGVTEIAALLAPMAIGGWSFAPSAILPKFSRINPLSGLQRMFSVRGLAELTKALLKAGLIGGVAILVLWKGKVAMLELAGQPF